MFKINQNQFSEKDDFYHRVFRSTLHAEYYGEVPALEPFNNNSNSYGRLAITQSSHFFPGILGKETWLEVATPSDIKAGILAYISEEGGFLGYIDQEIINRSPGLKWAYEKLI